MGKRDRFRALFTARNTTSLAPHPTVSLLPVQSTSSSRAPSPSPPSCLSTSSTVLPDATTQRSLVLQKALEKTVEELPQAQKEVFAQASKTIDEQTLLSQVRAHDATHKQQSSFRPRAERLSKFLHLLDTFMGGVAIGIQASPEISSLVVGSVRIVIDLAIKFTMYFSKLTDMICAFQDYLGPLAEYAKAADMKLVKEIVVNAYTKILCFGWKARHVFIDANDSQRKWTSFRTFMRQHWEPFESEFGAIKENLEHDVNILLHSVNALHFNLARKDEEARRRREEAKEKSEFLNWVSNIDFEQTHQDTFAKKHDKTGDWLINHPEYQQWLTRQRSCLLWCHGKPGIGKTVLASNVIEDVTKEITTNVGLRNDAALCFAYYHYQNTQLKDLHQIVAALIKQLCRRKIQLPPDLLETKRDALPPSLLGTRERFLSLIEDLSQVYIVLDALDECPEKERGDILGFITGIVTAQVGCQVKVFVTSRHEMDIDRAFSYRLVPTIQIQTKNVAADIEDYVRSQVEKLQIGGYGKTLYIRSGELKERIIQTLATKAEGMFLWVNLQLDSLCQASKAQKDQVVEAALNAMPQDLPETYVRIMERIEAQSPYMRELATNCLAWTIYAQRPLTAWELQEALAVSSNCETSRDLPLDSLRVILEACGNLLEESNRSIRPIHYTVQEFLTSAIQRPSQQRIREQLLDSKAMHNRLSLACLKYIGRPIFTRPCNDINSLEYSVRIFSFAGYACHSFDYHILLCGELRQDVSEKLESLLQQENQRLAAILQIKVLRDSYDFYKLCDRFNSMDFPITASTIVYSTLLYNIPTIRQRWIGQTPPTYALHLAASARLTRGVIRLLDAGCDVNEKDNAECTPLHYACLNGGMKTAQLLIEKGAEIEAESRRYGSPLQAASDQGHAQVVEMLLKHADFQKQDTGSRSALLLASRKGHEQVVEILLDNGANIDVLEGRCGALHAASKKGYEQLVRMLLNHGADASVKNGGFSALQAAAREGHEQIVRMLLDHGADANGIGDVSNALQAASYEGYEQIVQMLLDYGADVNAPGHNLGSALQAASSNGHKQIVQILLNHGADINSPGIWHGTALQTASHHGKLDVIQLLLDNGADINAPSGYLNSPLQAASYHGNTEAVKMLLSNGADINASYAPGYSTALHQAAHMGKCQVLQILLDSGADVNALSKQHGTVLREASRAGDQEIVKMLLARGANVNAPHDSFSSALQVASRKGHKEVVQMLLAAGAQYWEEYILSSCMDFFDSVVGTSI